MDEADAQDLNTLIYRKVRAVEQSFYDLGDMLHLAWHGSIWKGLGLDSWEQWLAGVRLTKGAASDMLRTKELRLAFPEYEPRILETNPANIRLLLPHLQQDRETREWCITADALDEGLEKANTRSWRQLREELNNDIDPLEPPDDDEVIHTIFCPHCRGVIRLSSAAKVVSEE